MAPTPSGNGYWLVAKDGGTGTYAMTIPTEAGPLHIAGSITDSRSGPLDQFMLSHGTASLTGIGIVVPTKGDCVVTPVTEILINILGTFSG